jgi:hypothetical protein
MEVEEFWSHKEGSAGGQLFGPPFSPPRELRTSTEARSDWRRTLPWDRYLVLDTIRLDMEEGDTNATTVFSGYMST